MYFSGYKSSNFFGILAFEIIKKYKIAKSCGADYLQLFSFQEFALISFILCYVLFIKSSSFMSARKSLCICKLWF
jgi:hypothetical protein